jgi:hypothetical protein
MRRSIHHLLGLTLCVQSGAFAATPMKEGWSQEQIDAFTAGCSLAIIEPAKRDYAAAAERAGNKSPKPFPEAQILASINPMCGCLAARAAEKWTFSDYFKSQDANASVLVTEALAGGRCKPEGVLGDAMAGKKGKR